MKYFSNRSNDYLIRLLVTTIFAGLLYLLFSQFLKPLVACTVSVVLGTYLRIIVLELVEKKKSDKK